MTQLKAGLTSDKKAKCGSTEDGGSFTIGEGSTH